MRKRMAKLAGRGEDIILFFYLFFHVEGVASYDFVVFIYFFPL